MKNICIGIGFLALCVVGIWWFLFAADEVTNYPPKNETIVAFGDSLVVGVGASGGNDFISLLSQKIGRPIINLGISGNTSAQGLARIDEVVARDPGTVIVLLGGNDYLQRIPRDQVFSNLRAIIVRLQAQGAVVVLLGVRGGVLTDTFETEFKALAKETGSVYVSDVLDGLVGNMTYMSDAVHPNDAGYAQIAERVFKRLRDARLGK